MWPLQILLIIYAVGSVLRLFIFVAGQADNRDSKNHVSRAMMIFAWPIGIILGGINWTLKTAYGSYDK